MHEIDKLWERKIKSILGILEAGEADHLEVASMAQQIGADYHGRFLVELLQNASDQARAAGMTTSEVVIVRTESFVAVSNQGHPFSDLGLKSITSIGLSPKDPQESIGNKGVGFKSVFQISAAPEIYSSSEFARKVTVDPYLRMRMSTDPFRDMEQESRLERVVREQLERSNGRYGTVTVDQALENVKAAAPFKFPITIGAEHFKSRLEEIGDIELGQTLVVLPLLEEVSVSEVVDRAIDEVIDPTGGSILFLPSVTTLRIIDRTRDINRTLTRQVLDTPRLITGEGFISTVAISITGDISPDIRMWRVMSRQFGTPDVVSTDEAARESADIHSCANTLPVKSWHEVRSAPVSVALPLLPASGDSTGTPFGAGGLICIGLPTKDGTGTPAWVDSHFHGTISRTGIDLSDNKYNALLFEQAVRLHSALIHDLKRSCEIGVRRSVTLAFERGKGPLADALYAEGGQAAGNVVLAADGVSYRDPAETTFLTPEDSEAIDRLEIDVADLHDSGLMLPDGLIAAEASVVLECLLGRRSDKEDATERFLSHSQDGYSILESLSLKRRDGGAEFWEQFLSWCVARFSESQLSEQRILPVRGARIARSSDKVFLPPARRFSLGSTQEEEDELSEIPDDVAPSLNFIDEAVVPVRKANSRDLTELAAKLATDSDSALVRRPRFDDLINGALGPLMQNLTSDRESLARGVQLLKLAATWMWRMTDAGRGRVQGDSLRLPVSTAGGQYWKWVLPSTIYFGNGWLGESRDSLFSAAYGDQEDRLLVPWDQFLSEIGPVHDQETWINTLKAFGVADSPRIKQPTSGRNTRHFLSWSYQTLAIATSGCPIPEAEEFWEGYLDDARRRSARTRSGQPYSFSSITWIDRLENPESRAAIVKLMLLNPGEYANESEAMIWRQDGHSDRTTTKSFWARVIHGKKWEVIPTQHGDVPSENSWIIGEDKGIRAAHRYGLLNIVASPFGESSKLLQNMGVEALPTASPARLLAELDEIGKRLQKCELDDPQSTLVLVQDLYARLQSNYNPDSAELPDLAGLLFPLIQHGGLVSAQGSQIGVAYLNNDQIRSGFIRGFDAALQWPLDTHRSTRALVQEIRRQLGDDAVTLVQEASVDTGFVESRTTMTQLHLSEWLEKEFPGESISTDIGCLIAYSGRVDTQPGGEQFSRIWQRFEQTKLASGDFPEISPMPYFYDEPNQTLQTSSKLSPHEILEASWMLVGQEYRDTWAVYARDLEHGRSSIFMRSRQITDARRQDVEIALGVSSSEKLQHVRSVCLAIAIDTQGATAMIDFQRSWDDNSRSIPQLCDWLGKPDLRPRFSQSTTMTEEPASLMLLDAVGIPVKSWQQARLSLGLPIWKFSHKQLAWNGVRSEVVAVMKTSVARSGRISLAAARPILESLTNCDAEEEFIGVREDQDPFPIVLATLGNSLDTRPDSTELEFIRTRLSTLMSNFKSPSSQRSLRDTPIRDIKVYLDGNDEDRSHDAKERFSDVTSLATELAATMGEQVDVDELASSDRIRLLRSGWWSNRFAILVPLQRSLFKDSPATARRMSKERVFRDPGPLNEMRARFPELRIVERPSRVLKNHS
ncbi:MAG: hypothetical protein HQ478_13545, partial [Chloroflexi bacterium]|nr:hypothetical protein [Chloroflexota bacterium]